MRSRPEPERDADVEDQAGDNSGHRRDPGETRLPEDRAIRVLLRTPDAHLRAHAACLGCGAVALPAQGFVEAVLEVVAERSHARVDVELARAARAPWRDVLDQRGTVREPEELTDR